MPYQRAISTHLNEKATEQTSYVASATHEAAIAKADTGHKTFWDAQVTAAGLIDTAIDEEIVILET